MIMYKKNQSIYIALFLAVFLCFSCDSKDDDRVSNDAIIYLTVMDENDSPVIEVPGDGETLLKLQAKIPVNADAKYRKVTFRTSNGQFLSSTTNTMYEKTVDANGIAEVFLKVPLNHDPLFLSAEIGADANKYISEQHITLLNVGEIINLDILDNNGNPISSEIRADGNTILTVKATVNFNSNAIGSIKFITSAGNFLGINNANSTVAINGNVATIQLKVPKTVGGVYLRAEALTNSNIFKNGTLPLTRAFADNIILEPSRLSIDSSDDLVIINTYLTRNIGYVSIGSTAQYKAFQLDNNNNEVEVGRFTGLAEAFTNDSSLISSVKFVPDTGDINFTEPIIIRVSARNDNDQEIQRSFILNN
ncbi:hypothetical protein SGQ83_00295 [Flavobacterium sp. Fl-318]|uniref:Uncharacterized protein n=1 Tax=Flavobacterium cupriresistens TaxID=2893885 RepID=A0ABU4R5B3_9FLAO|nr:MULTISPECIES: hypothetical protein [unclassified Flavobacterium]MDX6187775.1 hypothetical protein [Flavobacterium sp. Fl-318]UFH42302.1 hypothetical protein LNP23_21155 [Flavobacterium sp. F-323]